MSNPKLNQPVVDFDDLYPGRFMKCGELHGEQVTYTITDVTREELITDKGKKEQAILTFREIKQQLALNRTNGICLREMFGRRVANWIGKRITLRPDSTRFGAKTVPCIRVHGSPDIEGDLEAEITLPRKSPFTMPLVCTRRGPPSVGEYERCKNLEAFEQLEVRRKESWRYVPTADKPLVKAAAEACQLRLTPPPEPPAAEVIEHSARADAAKPGTHITFDPAKALEQLQKPADLDALQATWTTVCDHFDALGQDAPLEHEAAYRLSKELFDEHT